MTREVIIQEALSWVDTPYHHHARVKGVGIDCAQLVVACALAADLITPQQVLTIPNYPTQWHLHMDEERLLDLLDQYGCVRKDKQQTIPGDIITFRFGRCTSHLGIMVNETQFVHAALDAKKATLASFNQLWEFRWTHTYKFPGIIDG